MGNYSYQYCEDIGSLSFSLQIGKLEDFKLRSNQQCFDEIILEFGNYVLNFSSLWLHSK